MDLTISEMIEAGRVRIAHQEAQEKLNREEAKRLLEEMQQDRLEKIRAAFPETVRQYAGYYGTPDEWNGLYITIQVPDLAPIYAMVKEDDGHFSQRNIVLEHRGYGDYGFSRYEDKSLYLIPGARIAEVGDCVWEAVYDGIYHAPYDTNDLAVALALAEDTKKTRDELIPQAEQKNKDYRISIEEAQATPEPTTAEKLTALLREMIREEVRSQAYQD